MIENIFFHLSAMKFFSTHSMMTRNISVNCTSLILSQFVIRKNLWNFMFASIEILILLTLFLSRSWLWLRVFFSSCWAFKKHCTAKTNYNNMFLSSDIFLILRMSSFSIKDNFEIIVNSNTRFEKIFNMTRRSSWILLREDFCDQYDRLLRKSKWSNLYWETNSD